MKYAIVQPPYSRDRDRSDACFAFKMNLLDTLDNSVDVIVLPEYSDVPCAASTREEISLFIKNNRAKYRRKQECVADYFMNKDGTYTAYLKIIEPAQPVLELKLVVPNRQVAKDIYKKWGEKAADVYRTIYENLVD